LKLGACRKDAHLWGQSSKEYCRIAQTYILSQALTVSYYAMKGYVAFYNQYYTLTEKQNKLF
jgi:hypothetical protein